MKITFLVPPILDGSKQPAERTAGCTRVVYLAPNMYELTVAAVVEQAGDHDVRYRDFIYDKKGKDAFVKFLEQDDSELYFIWTVNLSIDSDNEAIRLIHEHNADARVVLLGPGATYFTKKCLTDARDIVVRGEPEDTVVELLECLERGDDSHKAIKGISYREGDDIKHNPTRPLIKDLDRLPLPVRHFIADRDYRNPKLKTVPYTTLVTSRNCPFHCIYCVPSSLTFAREIEHRRDHDNHKPPISYRSTASVAHELEVLHEQGYKAVGFMDDNFIWNEQRTRELCEALKRYGFVWGCQARVDAITEPIAKMLGESGCLYVDLGVESFDDEILKYVKKGITVDDIYRAVNLLKKYNVPVKLNILIGCSPLETRETVKHTLREAKKLKVDQVMFNIVSPFPGTEYHKLALENHWIDHYVPTDVQRQSILNLPHLSAREMEKLLFWNNVHYFLSWHFISTQLRRFSSWKDFTHALKALKVKLFG
ncbi:MAG: radical SAM protein [Muribaculaceae bacterium]|nr:radical SAM protein [Muribaculaceae bacterium]